MILSAINPMLKLLAVEDELARSELELLLITRTDCPGSLFNLDKASIDEDVKCIRLKVFEPVLKLRRVLPWSKSALYASPNIVDYMRKFKVSSGVETMLRYTQSLFGGLPTGCWRFKAPDPERQVGAICLDFVFYAGTRAMFAVVRSDSIGAIEFGQLQWTTLWTAGRVSGDSAFEAMQEKLTKRISNEIVRRRLPIH